KFYIDPEHPVVSINKYLPGVNITGLSITRLLNEINRAFIPTERPDYSKEILTGAGAAGVQGSQTDGQWQVGGGGLGSIITPTGGASFGGAAQTGSEFGGLTALAVPVGIPILGGPDAGKKVTGIDSMIAGVQRM